MNRDSRSGHFRILRPPISNQYTGGQEESTPSEKSEYNKTQLEKGIIGGVFAIITGLVILILFFYGTWVKIMITQLGTVATADVTGAQLQAGAVNLSLPAYSLPTDLLGYLHIPPYAFTLIQTVAVLAMILGVLSIASARRGQRTPTKILGVFTLILFALLMNQFYFLLHAFAAGAMVNGEVTLSFSEDIGLGFEGLLGGLGLMASGIEMALA